jgi:hypothetical protein
MYPGKSNMIRSICRSLEILLFFVMSVVGFSFVAKTTSLSSKSRIKSLSGSPSVQRELSEPVMTLHDHPFCFFFSPKHKSIPSLSGNFQTHPFTNTLHQNHLTRSDEDGNQIKKNQIIPSPLSKADNLFQQNPVLLM